MDTTDRVRLKIVCKTIVVDGVAVLPVASDDGTGSSAELVGVKQDDGSIVVRNRVIQVINGFLNEKNISFCNCKIKGITISDCKIENCECTNCFLHDCEIHGGSFDKTSTISGGDIYENSVLSGCRMTSVSLHKLTGSPISECTMKYCTFYGCKLDRVNRFGTIVDCIFIDTEGSLASTNVIEGSKYELAETLTRALSLPTESGLDKLDPAGLLLPKNYSEIYTAQDSDTCLKFGSSDGQSAVDKAADYIKYVHDIQGQEERDAIDRFLHARVPVVDGFVVLYYGDIVLLFTDSFVEQVVNKFDDEVKKQLIYISEFIATLLCAIYPKMCADKPSDDPTRVIPHLQDYVFCVLNGTCNEGYQLEDLIHKVSLHLGPREIIPGVVPKNCGRKEDNLEKYGEWCQCVKESIESMPPSQDKIEKLHDWFSDCVGLPERPCGPADPRPQCKKYNKNDHPGVQCMAGGITFNCTDPQTGMSFVAPHSIDKYRIGSADGPVHNCSCRPDTSQCEKCGKSQTECLVDAAVDMGYARGMCPGHWYTNPYDGFHQFNCFSAPFTGTYPCSDCI